jgi:hypothetical protein
VARLPVRQMRYPRQPVVRAVGFRSTTRSGLRSADTVPTSEAWEALDKTLEAIDLEALSGFQRGLSWKTDGK